MPNPHNIEAPVILISMQRSGTTLVHDIFRRHPDFNAIGETANLIFGVWHAVESTRNITSPLIEAGVNVPYEEKAARIVRQALWRLAQKYLVYKYSLLKGKTLAKANHVYKSLTWKR